MTFDNQHHLKIVRAGRDIQLNIGSVIADEFRIGMSLSAILSAHITIPAVTKLTSQKMCAIALYYAIRFMTIEEYDRVAKSHTPAGWDAEIKCRVYDKAVRLSGRISWTPLEQTYVLEHANQGTYQILADEANKIFHEGKPIRTKSAIERKLRKLRCAQRSNI